MKRLAIGAFALFALVVPEAAAAAPINDAFADRLTIQLQWADTRSNADATIETDEPLTPNDPGGLGCAKDGSSAPGGNQADRTLWWEFTGNGGPITVSSKGSDFDTVLAVYETNGRAFVTCNDDIQPFDSTRPLLEHRETSEVVVNTVAGRKYSVQVGGCTPEVACAPPTSGNVTLRVSPTPENDDRANALPILVGQTRTGTNTGGTLEPGEVASCHRYDGFDAPYAKTVWYRYHAPAYGTATFSASGFDTVIAVYRGNDAVPIGCNDDAIAGSNSASRLPMSQPAGPPVEVEPGNYYLQVGGYYDTGFTTVAARNGPLEAQVEFTEDTDIDNDGVDRSQDCDDANSEIRPGVREVPNNDVDEDCDGVKAQDQDGDGVYAPAAGDDCDDTDPRIRPGATEIEGNGVDEDCNGKDPPNRDRDEDGVLDPPFGDDCDPDNGRIRPGAPEIYENGVDEDCDGEDELSPRFDRGLGWELTRLVRGRYTRVDALVVTHVPAGATVVLTCSRRTCDRAKPQRRTFRRSAAHVNLVADLRATLKRQARSSIKLYAGTRVEIRVTKKGFTGEGNLYKIRRGAAPTEHRFCIGPNGNKRKCQ